MKCTWTQAFHAAVRQILAEVAKLRTPDGKPLGIAHRAAELLADLADRPRAAPAPDAKDGKEPTSSPGVDGGST
jgi:hypothetical protein